MMMQGQMGMYNPMMMNQMYGPMSNQMGIQTQMYNAQLQMQQNAYQQMAIQNSMMYGYNNAGGMYGMNNMYQSPMYGMGMQQAYYNPMSMYGYGNYYSPMMYPQSTYNPMGYLTGFGGAGFNAGINFNAGLNWY